MNISNSIFKTNLYNIKKQNYSFAQFSASNIAPLKADVVSFTGSSELIASTMNEAPPVKTCKQVHNNAKPAEFYLQYVLDQYISKYKAKEKGDNPKKFPILEYKVRTKSPTSIREKVVSKHARIHRNEIKKFSDVLAEAILNNFSATTNVSCNDLISTIRDISRFSSYSTKTPLDENIYFYLEELLEDLKESGFIKEFDPSSEEYSIGFANIIDELQTNCPNNVKNFTPYVNPSTIDGIKHYANDIVGARIVLQESGPEYTAPIFSALKKAVIDGKLKIKSIENNVPEKSRLPEGKTVYDYSYASAKQLAELAEVSGAELKTIESPSGYLAVHINLDLSDPMFKEFGGIYNGYSGEIQILGRDVEALKDVEDLCYKLKDNKNAINAKYKSFKDHFHKYYNEKTKKAFDDYTYDLYLEQRSIPPGAEKDTKFRSAASLGYGELISEFLDYNYLRSLKDPCDRAIEIQQREKEKEAQSKITPKEMFSKMKSDANIEVMKQIVKYNLN